MPSDILARVMLNAYEEDVQNDANNYFLSSLFREEFTSNTEKVEIDIMRENQSIAIDIARGSIGSGVNTLGAFSNKEYSVPLYREETPLTAGMINKRPPGIDGFSASGLSEAARVAYWIGKAQAAQLKKIKRAIELQASQALQTGLITLRNSDTIDFKKKSSLNNVPAVKWNAGAGSPNPLIDLEALCLEVFQAGKMKPNVAIFSPDAWQGFRFNAAVQSFFDRRNINPGMIERGEVMEGATFQGRIALGDYLLDLYTYAGFYLNESNVATNYMSAESVIVMNRNARLSKGFGAVEVPARNRAEYEQLGLPAIPEFVEGKFVPYYYQIGLGMFAGVQSAPIVMTNAIDTIGTISDCLV